MRSKNQGALRRRLAGLVAVWLALVVPAGSRGQEAERLPVEEASTDVDLSEITADPELLEELERLETREQVEEAIRRWQEREGAPPDEREPTSLPGEENDRQSAARPEVLRLPTAEGSLEGLGESFSMAMSTGAGSFGVPLGVAPGRGPTPSLSLSYSGTSGSGIVGVGWNLSFPFIGRQTVRGYPRYGEGARYALGEDRFFFNGGQELVPVSSEEAEIADCSVAGCATVPAALRDWQQYRARVEGGFLRFFRSPDGRRWVVQGPDGSRMDFGALPAGEGPSEMVSASVSSLWSERPGGEGRIWRWGLTRVSDVHGSVSYYQYDEHEGERYVRDIYYVSPHGACGSLGTAAARRRCPAPLADYGARVRLVYEARPDATDSYMSGWRIRSARRLSRVEVTSASAGPGSRVMVRRYHLFYRSDSWHSMLDRMVVEGGRSESSSSLGVQIASAPLSEEAMIARGGSYWGQTLPPIRFGYEEPPGGFGPGEGFGGLASTVRRSGTSPAHGVGASGADLFDVNSDGLVDLLVTGDGSGATRVYFNGFRGGDGIPAGRAGEFSDAIAIGVAGRRELLDLSHALTVPMDADGDGRSDLVRLSTRSADFGYFVVGRNGNADEVRPARQGWTFAWLQPEVAGDPRMADPTTLQSVRAFDANGDRLVDLVRSTGDRLQTWLNLGWLPGGEGRYGSYRIEGTGEDARYVLSGAPIETCLPHGERPLALDDDEVQLADMNGDGVTDLVRVSPGASSRIEYWPGRGVGLFGGGSETCVAPGYVTGASVAMGGAPRFGTAPDASEVRLTDVDGDGLSDLLLVEPSQIRVWYNAGGARFTAPVAIAAPHRGIGMRDVRLVDVDGSGTMDVLYAREGDWRWVDLRDGRRARVLVRVQGPLGAVSEVAYGTSTQDYLADLVEADSCSGAGCGERFTWSPLSGGCDAQIQAARGLCLYRSANSPVITMVVRESRTTDRFDVVGGERRTAISRYAYHDQYYEGIEQEVRGFRVADTESVGDAHHPTVLSRTWFHQGRRPNDIATDRTAENPYEPLKGFAYLTEVMDHEGVWLSSSHTSVRVRELMVGLDGRAVQYAHVTQTDALSYDTAPFVYGGSTIELPSIELQQDSALDVDPPHRVVVHGSRYAHVRSTTDEVSNLGHVLQATAWGRIRGEHGEPIGDEHITQHTSVMNVPGSESGWLWRTAEGHITGHGTTLALGGGEPTYDGEGNLIRSVTPIVQERLYAFAGDADGALDYGTPSPEPIVASTRYDVWGRPIASCAGWNDASRSSCLGQGFGYGEIEYETDYARYVVSESAALDRAGQMLTTTATHDQARGLVLTVTDANGQTGSVVYDGWGRVTASIPPPVTGCAPGRPSVRIRYEITDDPAERPVSRVFTTAELSCSGPLGANVVEGVAYIDGGGAVRATLSQGDDVHAWIRGGLTTHTARGSVLRSYDVEWYDGGLDDYAAIFRIPSTPFTETHYDAFGRATETIDPLGHRSAVYYHALSSDACDPNDLDASSPHAGTCTTARTDGHGRVIDQVQRNRVPGVGNEVYRLFTRYRADGAVLAVVRAQTTTDAVGATVVEGRSLERRFDYDSVGRRVATDDPDTDSRDGARTAANRSWRYLYNRLGQLAAVRDPRGCGQNFFYDFAGRIVGEQYVGCGEAQRHEEPVDTVPAGSMGYDLQASAQGVDVRLYYDSYDHAWADPTTLEDFPADRAVDTLGALVGSQDRASRSLVAYDNRGQAIWSARQIALMPAAPTITTTLPDGASGPALDTADSLASVPVQYDETHTYVASSAYDFAGRATEILLPRDPDYGGPDAPRLGGALTYDRRQLPISASIRMVHGGGTPTISGEGVMSFQGATITTHPVVASIAYDVHGAPVATHYATSGLLASFASYDVAMRPVRAWTVRTPTEPADPVARPLGAVATVADQRFDWDPAGNLLAVHDFRRGEEWPNGHRPQSVFALHDALYHVIGASFEYRQDSGITSTEDESQDWRAEMARTYENDPMRQRPAPMLVAPPSRRVRDLVWAFDWLGNMTEWSDDAHAFYERSLGQITNGADSAAGRGTHPALRPSALYLASDLDGPAADRGGWVELDYGESGNVVAMTVHAQCTDTDGVCVDPGGDNHASRRAQLRDRCLCAEEQHYQYRWDELNRLAEARRYDRHGGVGDWPLAARQRYRYDAGNVRIIKEAHTEPDGASLPPPDRYALTIIPGDFERRGLVRGLDSYDADPVLGSESQYLVAGARVVWQSGGPAPVVPGTVDRNHRITLGIGDLLGTTSAVVDLVSGQLLETNTYYPNGARETYRTTDQAPVAPEPVGFTTKEADEEVGLTYFGERYLIPRIGRWASPDPLHIHAMGGGETLNSFHYVSGNLLQTRDPLGLCEAAGSNEDGTVQCADGTWAFDPTGTAGGALDQDSSQSSAGAPAPEAERRGGRWIENPFANGARQVVEGISATPQGNAVVAAPIAYPASLMLAGIGAAYDIFTGNVLTMGAEVLDGAVARELDGDSWQRTADFDQAADGLLEVVGLGAEAGLVRSPLSPEASAIAPASARGGAPGAFPNRQAVPHTLDDLLEFGRIDTSPPTPEDVFRGGTGQAISAHGHWNEQFGYFEIPEGTTLTIPGANRSLSPDHGLSLEGGESIRYSEGAQSFLPGAQVPDYYLNQHSFATYAESTRPSFGVPLSSQIQPNMGHVCLSACTVEAGLTPSPLTATSF